LLVVTSQIREDPSGETKDGLTKIFPFKMHPTFRTVDVSGAKLEP
jgi:hypothetical protein